MRIVIGAAHAGFDLKEVLAGYLRHRGHEVVDIGTNSDDPVDYPDYAEKVATRVAARQADYGVLVCGTGVGMMLAANKVPGIRATPCNDTLSAHFARAHNNGNVLTMGSRLLDEATMQKVDSEIRRILDEQYALARKILLENRDKVEAMTNALLEWETIDADQIGDIMTGKPPRPPKATPSAGTPTSAANDGGAQGAAAPAPSA